MTTRCVAVTITSAVLLAASAARADDPTAAEAAFVQARALMRQGRYDEACARFEASYALDPALGTVLNLGDCFSKAGRTASAWLRFREAASIALRQAQTERETIARRRADELEGRLCYVTIRAPSDAVVRRDGVVVDPAAIGLRVPIDPGAHTVVAEFGSAPPFETHLDVPPDHCADSFVQVPDPPKRVVASPVPVAPSWKTMHTLAIGSAAVGVAAVGIGTIFGLSAASAKSEADGLCSAQGCSPEGNARMDDAGRSADVATIAFVTGGALVITGIALWLNAPSLKPYVVRTGFMTRF